MLKKLINDPFDAVDEMLEGYVAAHADLVRLAAPRVVARRSPAAGKVGLVIGGGSGHEPAFAGYVGVGLADAAALGNVFAAPSPDVCLAAIRAASSGRGVLLGYGNYAGDVLNFDLAAEAAAAEGIATATIRVTDDVASAAPDVRDRRRGIAGDVFVFKVAGAAAERGDSLDEVARLASEANAACRSMGVALSACEVPGAGRPTFEIGPTEMEIGMGVHGEPGIRRGPLEPADAVAHGMVQAILADRRTAGTEGGSDVALLVNGLGATPHMDLYILYRAARRALEDAGCAVVRSFVGEYITSLEMAGASVTVLDLDDERRALLDAPARTARLGG
ncbi:MAG TPA: dihydroxyacetone kinase subunit DhaK [Candidatus Sulfotelmatobacter sp.]|nr:dihydroxyacetone kinase subunit DhaK [Candidatus Sulfotelmatobacter sp.]